MHAETCIDVVKGSCLHCKSVTQDQPVSSDELRSQSSLSPKFGISKNEKMTSLFSRSSVEVQVQDSTIVSAKDSHKVKCPTRFVLTVSTPGDGGGLLFEEI